MTMCAEGLAKLIEECGELIQVAGKRLAYFDTDWHPDGMGRLPERLESEMADVLAAINFVVTIQGLNRDRINDLAGEKLALFQRWHADDDNNKNGVQLP